MLAVVWPPRTQGLGLRISAYPLHRYRADELIRMAEGKTTVEKVREGKAARVQAIRAKSPLRSGNSGAKPKSKPEEAP